MTSRLVYIPKDGYNLKPASIKSYFLDENFHPGRKVVMNVNELLLRRIGLATGLLLGYDENKLKPEISDIINSMAGYTSNEEMLENQVKLIEKYCYEYFGLTSNEYYNKSKKLYVYTGIKSLEAFCDATDKYSRETDNELYEIKLHPDTDFILYKNTDTTECIIVTTRNLYFNDNNTAKVKKDRHNIWTIELPTGMNYEIKLK